MSDFFDLALHNIGRKKQPTFVLNVGAMDGFMYDEMIGYTRMYDFKGLYVEPIPYLFERLKNNIGDGNLFENSAISTYDGEVEMMMIDQEAIDNNQVHSCFYGMSSIYPPKNGLASEGDKEIVEKYSKIVKVPCVTFETLLSKHNVEKFDVVKIDTEGHDFEIFKQIDLDKYRPSVLRLEYVNLSDEDKNKILEVLEKHNYKWDFISQDITAITNELYYELFPEEKQLTENNDKVTLVTGLWNIGRDNLKVGWSRSFDHYLEKFEQLLKVDINLIIYGDAELEKFVSERRKPENTQFIRRELQWFKRPEFYQKIQDIRNNPEWYNQSGWLKDSTQGRLEMYNPLVMCKMYLLHDAKIFDKFDSTHLFWIDAGLANTVHMGYFTHDKVQNKLSKLFNKFSFVAFPYKANNEIHGFNFNEINKITQSHVELVGRGGFFGGPKESITDINTLYYSIMSETLNSGLMGTEESLFSILMYKHPDLINYFQIESNGLINKFFEDVKNDTAKAKNTVGLISKNENLNSDKVGLYVITFNSPNQFRTLIKSMLLYDENYIKKTKKFLLDNSSDLSTTKEYSELCKEYGFEHIKKDNLGICGGRQFIAEHSEEQDLDFYLFFEDDMFFYNGEELVCKNGFNRHVKDLYNKSIEIVKKENFDFIKLNYTEFYGNNGTQWSWYNVPQTVREEYWPDKKTLPIRGLDPNAPKTKFNKVLSHKGVPYAGGEVYYCNWPQIVTKHGNKKMFLETKWARPFEQTWMSHIYQETVKGNINPGILLITPTEHDRFEHYDGKLRKES